MPNPNPDQPLEDRIAELAKQVSQQTEMPLIIQRELTKTELVLLRDYFSSTTYRLTSNVYSTDKKDRPLDKLNSLFPICNQCLDRGDYGRIRNNQILYDTYYYKYDGLCIVSSLIDKVQTKAQEIGADLVILNFTTKRPFKFRIYKVSGLGKYNYVGEISAKFYARK